MGLKDELLRMIAVKGYDTSTPIQIKTIPLALYSDRKSVV